MPRTTDEIAAFLAQSTQAYKPLEQLPVGRIVHRPKSSLNDARSLCSPYGLPLPKPVSINKPKMSLTTKYDKKSSRGSKASTTPSAFSFAFFPDDVPEAPASAPIPVISPFAIGFAPFARETPSSPPPKIAPFKPISPFQLPVLDAFGIRKHLEDKTKLNNVRKVEQQSERKRVDSKVKRQALGWGRKRDSDRPEMIVNVDKPAKSESGPKFSAPKPLQLKPLILPAKASARLKNKENVYMDETSSSFISGPERAINKPCAFTPIKFC